MRAHRSSTLFRVVGLQQHTPLLSPKAIQRADDVLKVHNPEQTLLSLGFAVVDLLNSGVIAGENGGLTLVEDRVLSPQRGVEPRLRHEQNQKDSFALFKDKCQDSAPQIERGMGCR